ncbi:N-acetylglucosamine kinase [Leifsonia poae]|uniref:N-acetylglucosamine kinase n=1 Tax=Leifsonia poae TaxID=110933 RepID=UPI001CC156B9|nr:BadF/BadG/BcrA/BcrD ATPase family protein [Leifsonia poae]
MTTPVAPSSLSVDLGKTQCRIRVDDENGRVERHGPGFPGFAAASSVELALAAVVPLVETVGLDRVFALGGIGIGAAGVDSGPANAREFALQLRQSWHVGVVVASDVLTAHLGAFAGGAGTVLIAGTGAVAYRIDDGGEARRSDGWGPWLGDEGSGRWIGQAGLIRALRSADGRGPATTLEQDARDVSGELGALPRVLTGGDDVARSLASFAPTVLRRAAEGDDIASAVVAEAIGHLAATTASIAEPGDAVSVIGGVADDPGFRRRLLDELTRLRLTPHRPAGTPLDGAATLAVRRDLPHERYAIRV